MILTPLRNTISIDLTDIRDSEGNPLAESPLGFESVHLMNPSQMKADAEHLLDSFIKRVNPFSTYLRTLLRPGGTFAGNPELKQFETQFDQAILNGIEQSGYQVKLDNEWVGLQLTSQLTDMSSDYFKNLTQQLTQLPALIASKDALQYVFTIAGGIPR
mgnify:FL=1